MSNRASREAASPWHEAGSVAILVAITIVVLLGFAAIVVDSGFMFQVRNELQNASDSAALAGARSLDGTQNGMNAAVVAVNTYAQTFNANNTEVRIDANDIVLGHWYYRGQTPPTTSGCSGKTLPCFDGPLTNPPDVNGVQVSAFRTKDHSNTQLKLNFGAFAGKREADISTKSIAVGGGAYQKPCGFPMVVSECPFKSAPSCPSPPCWCGTCFFFQDDGSDTAGWTTFNQGSVNPNTVDALVSQACATVDSSNTCQGSCGTPPSTATVGDQINLNNGNGVLNKNSTCETIENLLNRDVPAGTKPTEFLVQVPVVASDSCPDTKFTGGSGNGQLVGFSTLKIVGVQCGNNQPVVATVPGQANKCWNMLQACLGGGNKSDCGLLTPPNQGKGKGGAGKYIVGELDCSAVTNQPSGGGSYGTLARRVRLVQ